MNERATKLLSVNIGSKGFRTAYDASCARLGIDNTVIRSRNSWFELNGNSAKLYHQGTEIRPDEFGYVFIRVSGNYTLMTSLIAQYFKAHNVPISDDVYLQHTSNEEKVTQMLLLTLAGLPIPRCTLFVVKAFEENKDAILSTVTFPCVLKTNGSKGRNVWKIENREALEGKLPELDEEVAMLQAFVPNTSDIRAIYIDGEVIGAIQRSSVDGFHNNVSRGGTAEMTELSPEEIDLAKQSCKVLGRSFGGVDIVRTPDGPKLFEVNLGPQIYGFERATGINVPDELLKRIKNTYLP